MSNILSRVSHVPKPLVVLVATIAILASTLVGDAGAQIEPGGVSINHGLCENGGNTRLGHPANVLPVDVCFNDETEQLVVKNVAPYWITVGLPSNVTIQSRDVLGLSDTTDAALALFIGRDGRVIPPGAVFTYNVSNPSVLNSLTFVFDRTMHQAEVAVDAFTGIVGGDKVFAAQVAAATMNLMYENDSYSALNLGFEALLSHLVKANLLSVDAAGDLLSLAPDSLVNQVSAAVRAEFAQSIVAAWAAKFVLTLAQILARNVDYIDALDRFDAGNLSIFPRATEDDPVDDGSAGEGENGEDDQSGADDGNDDVGSGGARGRFELTADFKIVQPEGSAPGDAVSFSYSVRNVGDAALTAKVFSVPIRTPGGGIADVECGDGRNVTLQPGASFDCSATRGGLTEVGRYEAWADWQGTDNTWHQGDLGDLKTFQIAEEGESTPSRPREFTVTSKAHDHVNLGWEGSVRSGNPALTAYVVREQGTDIVQCEVPSSVLECRADTNLSPDTEYTFEIVAVNGVGDSPVATVTVRTDPAPENHISVRARGERGEEEFELQVNGKSYGKAAVTRDWSDYSFTIPRSVTGPLAVVFSNDFYDGGDVDRNLEVDSIVVNGDVYETESDGTYSEGVWSSEEGCSPGFRQNELVSCGGRLIFGELNADGSLAGAQDPYLPEEEEADETPANHVVRVRARGTTGGERFALRIGSEIVDHVVVGKKWRTYRFKLDQLPTGSVVLGFMNDSDDGVNDFNLQVDFVKIDDRRFETESSGTWSSTAGDGPECISGHRSTEFMYCNGAFFFTDL